MNRNFIFAAASLGAFLLTAAPGTDYEKMGLPVTETSKVPLGTKWHADNAALVEKETSNEALAAWTASPEKAAELLSRVKTGYQTRPIDAVVIGSVTQYVMENAGAKVCGKAVPSRDGMRRLWTESLISALSRSADSMIAHFYLDNLRWCAYEDQVERITGVSRTLAERFGNKELLAFAGQLAREIRRDCPGLK